MEFKNILNSYIEILNCSSKDLADASGISTSTISRYRSGERVPTYQSKQFNDLISGISKIAKENKIKNLAYEEIKLNFSNAYGKNAIDFDILRKNLNLLISRSKYQHFSNVS